MGSDISVCKLNGIFLALQSLPTELLAHVPTSVLTMALSSYTELIMSECSRVVDGQAAEAISLGSEKNRDFGKPSSPCTRPASHTQVFLKVKIKSVATMSILSGPRCGWQPSSGRDRNGKRHVG